MLKLTHFGAWLGTSPIELKVAKQIKYNHRDRNLVLVIAWARIIAKAACRCLPKGLGKDDEAGTLTALLNMVWLGDHRCPAPVFYDFVLKPGGNHVDWSTPRLLHLSAKTDDALIAQTVSIQTIWSGFATMRRSILVSLDRPY